MAGPIFSETAVPVAAARTPGEAYALLAFLIAMTLCLELARLPLIVLVDPVRRSFGVGDVEVSLLLGILSSAPFVIMSIAGGWLSDRYSRRLLLCLAAAFWVAGALICAGAQSFVMLAVGRVLIGVGAGMKLPVAMTWINDAFPPSRRGRAVGAFFVVLGCGPSLAIILAGVTQSAVESGLLAGLGLGQVEPWRATMALLALPSLVVGSLLWKLPDQRAPRGPSALETPIDGGWMPIGLFAVVIGGASLMAFVDAVNLGWVSTIFIRNYGFDARQAGVVFGVATMIAGLAGPLIGGSLGDRLFRRFGPRGRVALAGAAALACAPLLAAYLAMQPTVLGVALTLSGVCTVTALSLAYVTVQQILPPRSRGLGTGIMSATTTLVGSTGPTLVALTAARCCTADDGLIIAVVLVGGGAATLAGLLLLFCAMKLGAGESAPDVSPLRAR